MENGSWLIPMSVIQSGNSAILNDNYFAFYWIHVTGMILTFTSLTCCLVVIKDILTSFLAHKEKRNVNLWDFSDRFPLYIAIADALWGIMNISGNHAVLLFWQVLPPKGVAEMIAAAVSFFYGYQQLMTAGLSLYTYLKVVRNVTLNLGRLEWKLHLAIVIFLVLSVAGCLFHGAYGNSGYWFMEDWSNDWGKGFACNIVVTANIHALLTTLCYRSIRRVIMVQEQRLMENNERHNAESSSSSYHGSAIKCLTTYVVISLFLYWPFAILGWIFLAQHFYDFQEPTTIWLVALTANCGGWVNSWGYFHNKKIKNAIRQPSVPQVKCRKSDMTSPISLSSSGKDETNSSFLEEAIDDAVALDSCDYEDAFMEVELRF